VGIFFQPVRAPPVAVFEGGENLIFGAVYSRFVIPSGVEPALSERSESNGDLQLQKHL
jgi:hypothetical protein